jgi:hypothetical protein
MYTKAYFVWRKEKKYATFKDGSNCTGEKYGYQETYS